MELADDVIWLLIGFQWMRTQDHLTYRSALAGISFCRLGSLVVDVLPESRPVGHAVEETGFQRSYTASVRADDFVADEFAKIFPMRDVVFTDAQLPKKGAGGTGSLSGIALEASIRRTRRPPSP
jgi:hypothetical protein